MLSANLQWMDQTCELDAIEPLYPLVRVFKETLTAVEWAELELGALEKTLEAVVKHCCMQIVVAAVKYRDRVVCKEPEQDLATRRPQTDSGWRGFQTLALPEQKVLKCCLGDVISLDSTELKATLETIWDSDKEVVIEFLMKEITRAVTVELSRSSAERGGGGRREGKSRPLDALRLTIMLDKNLDFLVEMLQRHTAWISCLPTLHDSPVRRVSDAEQGTPSAPGEEISSSAGPTTVQATELPETVSRSANAAGGQANVALEGCNRILEIIFQNTLNVASEIVRLTSDNSLGRQIVGDSKSEAETRRKEAQGKISALLIRSFAKMSVVNLVTKLRGKHESVLSTEGHRSLLRLLDGVEHLADQMLSLDGDQRTREEVEECHYGRAARRISVERQKLVRKRLCTLALRHLNAEEGKTVCSRQEVRVQVDACIEEMVRWLNRQATQHSRKGGITADTLEEVRRELANLLPAAGKPWTEKRAGPKVRTPPTSSPSDVSDDDDDDEPTAKADPVLEGLCTFVITQLVRKILANYYFHPSEAGAIAQTLKEMLLAELAGVEIVVELNDGNTKKIVKAVERELLRRMGSSGLVKQAMWAKRDWVFQCIVEHLRTLLLTPLRTSRFFYFKPLSLCFRGCSSCSMVGSREH